MATVAVDGDHTTICWFRRDLRLGDHPALCTAAAEARHVVPLFVVDPRFDGAGWPRRKFLLESLRSLDAAMGGALVVRRGDPAEVVSAVAAEVGARQVLITGDFAPYGRERDRVVAERLALDGRRLRAVGTPYAVAPGAVRKADGGPFAVFTPFRRAWTAVGWPPPLDDPDVTWRGRGDVSSDPWSILDPGPGRGARPGEVLLPSAGEASAHGRWEQFQTADLDRYDDERNRPDLDTTSRLSVYLRFGTIHPRQLLAQLGMAPSTEKAHDVFTSELAWREFYADVLHRQPHTAWKNLQTKMDAMPVDTGAAARHRFRAWCDGVTGYPLVDAGMRQLAATGWMHNRVRMVVASFLVKDLHLPWQWGARHFMEHLVDGDVASNNHGWQWAAGTGTDAAPYFRVFNPTSQAERFDPDGTYIRRWLPALAEVDERWVHAPWQAPGGVPDGYAVPIVDHAVEREEALRRLRSIGTR